jgi:hypothetical protein
MKGYQESKRKPTLSKKGAKRSQKDAKNCQEEAKDAQEGGQGFCPEIINAAQWEL